MDYARLAAQLAQPTTPHGPVVVLSGRHETPDPTPARLAAGYALGSVPLVAKGDNTADEARRVLELTDGHLTVVTSESHMPRAFLTFLRALQHLGREREVRLWMVGVPTVAPRVEQEVEKIACYQAIGDVASYDEGWPYLSWRDAATVAR